MSIVAHFEANTVGRDFAVGDIHGCFDALRDAMKFHDFCEETDRLFSVGDLVDRGSQCEESIDWIAKPWFHAIRGNHEQMAIGVANGKHDLGNYMVNGGGWFLSMENDRQKLFADVFDDLPYAMDVQTPAGLVGFVHAECDGDDWQEFLDALQNAPSKGKFRNVAEIALWSRTRITHRESFPIKGLAALFCGHTPVDDCCSLGNVIYIDCGAVFGGKLAMVEFTDMRA